MALAKLSPASQNRTLRLSSQLMRSFEELYEEGRTLRNKCPSQSRGVWKTSRDRSDPIWLVQKSSRGRIPHLIPIRYGRMMQSPFTFYRSGALNMAADLATTPVTGLRVQACGDCHLLNFPVGAIGWPSKPVAHIPQSSRHPTSHPQCHHRDRCLASDRRNQSRRHASGPDS
jgi:hypothetical protein